MHQRVQQSAPSTLSTGTEKPRHFRTEGGLNEHFGWHETATSPVVAPVSNGAWLLGAQAIKRLVTGARIGRIALLKLALLVFVSAALVAIGSHK